MKTNTMRGDKNFKKNFEYIRVTVYEDINGNNPDFTAGGECHYKTRKILLPYSSILAITTKKASCDSRYTKLSRGGALIFVKGRKEPYLTNDEDSFSRIISRINRNPFGCCSGLFPVGANIYSKAYSVIDKQKILIDGTNIYLYITKETNRRIRWTDDIIKRGKIKKSCPHLTRKRTRKKKCDLFPK